jgi:hypothetical protein
MKKIYLSLLLISFVVHTYSQAIFQQVASIPGFRSGDVTFADIDNDNDMDIFILGTTDFGSGGAGNVTKLYTNDGSGSFTEVIGTPFATLRNGTIAFADVDNDNDQDVLIVGVDENGWFKSILYTNDGGGVFTEIVGTPFDGVKYGSVAFADVDGDNDQDVLITGFTQSQQPISKLYTNNGSGVFTEVIGTPFVGVLYSSVDFADVDGDNDQDVLITGLDFTNNVQISKLYINNGSGIFSESIGTPFDGVREGSVAFADIDGDNDQDVLITGQIFGASAKLYVNNGNGVFTELLGTPFQGVMAGSVAFADVDNDNDQDLLITGFEGGTAAIFITSKLYINNGGNNFSLLLTPLVDVHESSIAFADIDGDNDQDVLITGKNRQGQLVAYIYSNTCHYTTSEISTEVCYGSNYIFPDGSNNNIITDTTFSQTIQKNDGCDSIITTNLLVNPTYALSIIDSICSGGSYIFPDGYSENIYSTTNYVSNFQSFLGCDSLVTTQLYLYPLNNTTILDTICKGETYVFDDGHTVNIYSDTNYIFTIQTAEGCDSSITYNIYLIRLANATVLNTCDTTSLYVTGDLTSYTWSNGVQNGVPFTPYYELGSLFTEITYYVNGITSSGCAVEDSITINYAGNLMPVLNINDVSPLGPPPGHNPRQFLCGDQYIKLQPWGMVPGGGYHMNTTLWTYNGWDNGIVDSVYFNSHVGDVYTNIASHPYGCYDTLTVVIIPSSVVGITTTPSSSVCVGEAITLKGVGIDYYGQFGNEGSYSWDNGVVDSVPFVVSTSNNYTVTGTDRDGCVDTETVFINVNPKPTVTVGDFVQNPICLKDNPVPLPLGTPSGGTYSGQGIVGNDFNPNFAGGIGMHTIDYDFTDQNGCTGTTSTDIEIIGSPSFSYQTDSNSVTLLSNISCFNYYWDFGDGNTNSFTLNPSYTYATNGARTVCLVCDDIVNCASCVNLNFPSSVSGSFNGVVGVEENIKNSEFVSVAPNPTNGVITIELLNGFEFNKSVMSLVDFTGKLVLSKVLNINESKLKVDLSDFSTGIYFLKLQSANKIVTKKIIKQ